MFNFSKKRIDALSIEVDRLNTVVTVLMKEIALLKNANVEKQTKNANAQQQNANSIQNAYSYGSVKAELTKSSARPSETSNNDVSSLYTAAILASCDDSPKSSSSSDYGSSHSSSYSSSYSSSDYSSSSDSGSCSCD